jgi:hypothetical protein
MAPPTYKNVGKAANDLFGDDFGASSDKVTFKSKTSTGLGLKIEGSRSKGPVAGVIETTWNTKNGMSIKEKWTTKNVVTTEVGLKDKLLKNSDVTLSADITPTTHVLNNWSVKSKYTVDRFATTLDVSPKSQAFGGVFSYDKFVFGASVSSPLDFSKFNFGVAGSYSTGGLVLTTKVEDSANVNGSVFHKCCDNFNIAAKFGWTKSNGNVSFGVASKYNVDKDTTLKAKVDQDFNMNFSVLQTLSKNVSARVSADVPAKGDSKIGLNLTINA